MTKGEYLALETRQAASEVFVRERTRIELTGQETLSERRIRDDGDAQLGTSSDD